MAIIDGLVALVQGTKDFFAAQQVTAAVAFGWKAHWEQLNQGPGGANRVVFIPGRVDLSAPAAPRVIDAGTLSKPRKTHDNPRELAWWHKPVTLSIWGVDTTDRNDDLKQYAATVALFEQTMQAIHGAVFTTPDGVTHNVGLADVIWEEPRWIAPPVEMGFGRCLGVVFTHNGPLFDLAHDVALPAPQVGLKRDVAFP